MKTSRSRVLAAPRDEVWAVIADPYHMPRWWPRVKRVERVTARGWTAVLQSKRGNAVRIDWSVDANEQPTLRRFYQELDGTPFERLFRLNMVTVQLDTDSPSTTLVTMRFDQIPRGVARLMPFMLKRAMRTQIDEALDTLALAVE